MVMKVHHGNIVNYCLLKDMLKLTLNEKLTNDRSKGEPSNSLSTTHSSVRKPN